MAISYELATLEELITDNLHPGKLLNGNSITNEQFGKWNQQIMKEKDSIRIRLKKAIYSTTEESHRKLFIEQHQYGIWWLDKVLIEFLLPIDVEDLAETKDDSKLSTLHKRCLAALQDLICFIESEFPYYFNDEESIPASRLLHFRDELKSRLAKIRKRLLKSEEDASLVELVTRDILRRCNDETGSPLTYARWRYFRELFDALERMNPEGGNISHYTALIVQLVCLNFNATVFKEYLVKMIRAEINAGASLNEKIEIVSFHQKEMSQLPVKSGMALTPSLSSVQHELESWLFAEMTHLEKKRSLTAGAPAVLNEPAEPYGEKGIFSQLTVKEIGLLFKVMKENDLLKNKNMKEVARLVAKDWHSKQKENISWQYLYNSMSTVEMETIKTLENKLVGLVNLLRKMRGGMR